MLSILKKKNVREEEIKKQEEEKVEGGLPPPIIGKKKVAAEIRLKKEITELDLPSHAQVNFPDENNIMSFELFVDLTKEECLWKGAKYKFTVLVSTGYPHDAPKCHCETQIFHPNIDMQGNVCLNILRADWKPVLGINAVILGLIFLFIEPNPNDPLNKEAAELMRNNEAAFKDKVKKSLKGGIIDGFTFPKLV
jgi:ubiquitin-conjugating enzyme E2 M